MEAAPAVAPKAAASAAELKASQPGRAAVGDAKPAPDAKPSIEASAKLPSSSVRASTDAKPAADLGTAGDRYVPLPILAHIRIPFVLVGFSREMGACSSGCCVRLRSLFGLRLLLLGRPGQRAAGNQGASAQPATAHRHIPFANGAATHPESLLLL